MKKLIVKSIHFIVPAFCSHFLGALIILSLFIMPVQAQHYEAKSVAFNALIGGFSGGVGAIINKHPNQKWGNAFGKGFLIGSGGGLLMYGGKKLNYQVGDKESAGYAWLSRAVFSAGNSIVENAAANVDFWSQFHYDIGFVRLEFKTGPFNFTPRVMPLTLSGVIFLAANGKLNANESIRSGTLTFKTPQISYAPQFMASTPTNGILHIDTLVGSSFYDVYGHELVHSFQFQQYSGVNYFFKPMSDKWKTKSPGYAKTSKWIYLDLNYPLFIANYYLINGGHKSSYCNNFLENEAEILSVECPACH
ncbi:MAG: hypothetical protein ABI723_00850 [Bacteroidia bacterium]